MTNENTGSLSVGKKFGYGIGSIGQGLAYCVFYTFFIFFLTDYAGISPAIAGTISLIAISWDAITDPFVGHLSDKSKNPKGRRRPFMMKAIIPFGLTTWLLFTNIPSLDGGMKVAYYLVINLLFWLSYTFTDIPYMTMGGEIAGNNKDRIGLRSYAIMFYYIGYEIGTAGTLLLVDYFAGLFGDNFIRGWSTTSAIFGLLVFGSYVIAIVATKGRDSVRPEVPEGEEEETLSFFKSVSLALKVKPFLCVMGYALFMNIGIAMVTAAIAYVALHYVGMSNAQLSLYFTIYVIAVIVCSPIVPKFFARFENRNVLMWSMIIGVAIYVLLRVIPYNSVTIYLSAVANVCMMLGWGVISYAMVYDVADVAPLKTKIKNGAMIVAGYQFMIKFSGAIATWLLGLVLAAYQYDGTAEVLSEFTLKGILNLNTIIPAAFMIFTIPCLLKYKLTEKNMVHLRDLLKRQDAGEKIDENEYKGLL